MRWHPPSSSWMAGCELSDPHQAEFHRCCQHPEDGRLEITRRASQVKQTTRDNVLDASFDDQVRRSGQLENSTTVCWISMTFALEEHFQVGNHMPDGRDRFLFFRGVVAQATYDPATPWNSQPKLSDESSASRSVVLRELQWTAELEIQGGYVAVPT
ncbi:hypothetical protein JG688_00013637 [Phytophthora aleatoria]|uniref:Uncharacterized protein n=1 Tax=Phytophthora aleatoria TaxID=2496075 RepID=A0A8J5IX03_9STRA|nr:hypothetical protein JG688_00013637 [Phytophthora aleatoria]